MALNVGILDIETNYDKRPGMSWPWIKGAYMASVGLQVYLPSSNYYKDWVFDHSEYSLKAHGRWIDSIFEIQEEIDKLDLLVGHSFKFDMNWLKWYNVDFSGVDVWDTKMAQFMLYGQDKTRPTHLNDCLSYWGLDLKDDKVRTYWDAGRDTREIPLSILLPYQKQDCIQEGELFKMQYRHLATKYPKLFTLAKVRNKCLHPVTDIEISGMPFDRPAAEHYVKEFTQQMDITDAELRTYFGRDDFNFSSGRDLSAGLFGGTIKRERHVPEVYTRNITYKEAYPFTYKSGKQKGMTVTKYKNRTLRELTCKRVREEYEVTLAGMGFEPDPKTEGKDRDGLPNGVYKTNKNVLKNLKCNNKGGTSIKHKRRVLELLLHRSKIGKFCETFVGAKKDTGLFYRHDLIVDGKLHPSYNQTIAATGRFTSSNPNGQNFPRSKEDEDGFTNPLKRCFVPSRPDGLILVIDLSQLEWRVAAWLSQDPIALQEIYDDIDIHLDNAVRFFGDAKFRQAAKIMTFRLLYGGSAYAFYMDPLMPDFSQKRWNTIVEEYSDKYFVLHEWQRENIRQVGFDNGYLYSPTGRIYRIPQTEKRGVLYWDDKCIKNYPVQGTATGDIVPLAMNMIWDKFQEDPAKYQSTNWMGQVHDSVLFDTMPHEVKQVAFTGISVFEQLPDEIEKLWGIKVNVPLTGEAEWGPNYGEMTHSVKHVGGQWKLKTN